MKPKRIGNAVLFTALFAALVLLLLWFQGIIGRPDHGTVRPPEPPALRSDQQTAEARAVTLATREPYPGFVEAIDPATLASRVSAMVFEVHKREGDAFEAGELLVALDDRDATARVAAGEAALASAEAEAQRAGLEFARVERLLAADAATEREHEGARAADLAATAAVARVRSELEAAVSALRYHRLIAPFAGRVLAKHIDAGSLANPGQPLLQLYRADALRLRFGVPEARATELEVGAELAVTIAGVAQAATLTRVLPGADPGTGTVLLHLALPAGVDARPGTYARLDLPTGMRRAVLVPRAALRRTGQIESVGVVANGRVTTRTVKTGKHHDDDVEILAGLGAGERVVLR